MYKKINDYGIIGNLFSVALIGRDASIDWLCLPYMDSPSVFGALLDDQKGGRFAVTPAQPWDSVANYLPDTNILRTCFRTRTGVMEVTDFMPMLEAESNEGGAEQRLYRLIEITRGDVEVDIRFEPRFDYARADCRLEQANGAVHARWNDRVLSLQSTRTLEVTTDVAQARWKMSLGDRVCLLLGFGKEPCSAPDPKSAEQILRSTEDYWRNWLQRNETGRSIDLGPYQPMVDRSTLTLKLLDYGPTGAIAAAATTSLPEEIGGIRNWDYRYTWIRDTSFTVQALFNTGHLSEIYGYLKWIEKLLAEHGAAKMQIMYGLRGEQELPEIELTHLDGYKGSKPVRIGNGAAKQRQLDIYGEIMDAALKLSDYVGKIDAAMWPLFRGICDYVVDNWHARDSGIWEVRGGPYHFVYSKVMCWVALDRGLTIARRYGFPADTNKWKQACAAIKQEVLTRGWNDRKKSFVQHYETEALDASNLLIPLVGFLPFDDPHVVSTIDAAQRELSHNGFLYRYIADDGLRGEEGTFLLCTFWLTRCLIGLGRLDEAEVLLKRVEAVANRLGLFAEEYNFDWDEALGNFPQAFTHIGYINSVIALREAQSENNPPTAVARDNPRRRPGLFKKIILNDGQPSHPLPVKHLSRELKRSMNVLRGAFFDTKQGRIAYEAMRKSGAFADYVQLSYSLKNMDLNDKQTPEEKMAFWINLYNVIIVHAVAELGLKDSIKEVWNIFNRVQYQIGGHGFTPYEIEHGILRGNRRPPYSLFQPFGRHDQRRRFSVAKFDPRVHFTLVCASSSCPPIEVYTSENLNKELTIASESFLNGGGILIDKEHRRVTLSRIFKWYRHDFGGSNREILKTIAPFLFDEQDRRYLLDNAVDLRVEYQDYDWRLNRG